MASTLDYAPKEVALILQQGDDWAETFAFRNATDPPGEYWDLTTWTGLAQIRLSFADDEPDLLAEMTCTGSVNGMTVSLTRDQTLTLPKKCRWELQLETPGGSRRTWLRGPVTVEREVAREVVP